MNKLLRRTAQQLRYRPLPELIGSKVTIESAASVPNAVGAMLTNSFPLPVRFIKPEEHWITVALAKYRILDLTFAVENVEWQPDDIFGTSILKKFGFALHPDKLPEDQRQFMLEQNDPTCINELTDGIDRGETVLRLFFEALPRQELIEYLKEMMRAGKGHLFEGGVPEMELVLEDFFPHEMLVTDACLTNAAFIWFHKHFYL
jgi:hypothetical protein